VFEVEITAEGLRHLNGVTEKVRHAALESITGSIAENPCRVGMPLVAELAGLWSARRGGYRIIYEIVEEDRIVLIHRVQHRRRAYRTRL